MQARVAWAAIGSAVTPLAARSSCRVMEYDKVLARLAEGFSLGNRQCRIR